MGILVSMGAVIKCPLAMPPGTTSLIVIPKGIPVMGGGPAAATIMDFAPMANIPPFGACMSPTNPQVAAATAAALGVLTPQPCIPVITGPWKPGSPMVMINNSPALTNTSTCQCAWGGVITVMSPGQTTVMAP